jgi:hypothetical protein
MHDQRTHMYRSFACVLSLCLLATAVTPGLAADILSSNKQPLSLSTRCRHEKSKRGTKP